MHYKVLALMMRLTDECQPVSFRKSIWLWTKLGRYTCFRRQEFAMESRSVIQVYVKPNGTHVVRTFTTKDYIWYNDNGMIVALEEVLQKRLVAAQVCHHYEIQKNRMNNQIVTQNRDTNFPKLCAVEASIEILKLAMSCGEKDPEDPLWVFQTVEGTFAYLTGDMITKYYRYVTQMVFPSISADELKLFSCHSLRVKAAVLLHEAGKYGSYI